MARDLAPISIAGSRLEPPRHVCALFSSQDESYRLLLPFIKEGLGCGDKAVYIVDPARYADHRRRLADADIEPGEVELRSTTDTYLVDGQFDVDRMLEAFERMASRGSVRSRIVCHMDWAAQGGIDAHRIVEFEARVNDVWRRHDDAVICAYDLAHFSGEMVVDILRTHPVVILGGTLQENPFFVPPEELLRELRERRPARTTAG